jgi:hypothetical protein
LKRYARNKGKGFYAILEDFQGLYCKNPGTKLLLNPSSGVYM